jgi:hypothetical protein
MKLALLAVALLVAQRGEAQEAPGGAEHFSEEAVESVSPQSAPPPAAEHVEPQTAPPPSLRDTSPQGDVSKVPVPAPDEQRSLLSTQVGAIDLAAHVGARTIGETASGFAFDDSAQTNRPGAFTTRLRLGGEAKYSRFTLLGEMDAFSGAVASRTTQAVATQLPNTAFDPVELRQLYLEYRWGTGAIRVGQQTSQLGLGMVAGSGERDAEAGDFGVSRFGSLAWRALIAGRPLFSLGGAWRAVEPVLAADLVARDATADFNQGDRAFQGTFALRFNADEQHQAALAAVYRHQSKAGTVTEEAMTDVWVLDASAKWKFLETPERALTLAAEVAGITGTTTQGRTDVQPKYAVRQFGAVAKAAYRYRWFGAKLDAGYASGDADPYDGVQSAFRFDRDFHAGLVLFDQVLAYQSARSAYRAVDPLLSGVPPEGVRLLPTQGAMTGAFYLFPRVQAAATSWLDVYGGPMFAFATAPLIDPFQTRLNGGVPVNALGGRSGSYLGTELDLGVQVRFGSLPVSAVLEGGLLLPGDAFTTASGGTMAPVGMVRARLAAQL